jgi:hypothetical protein
MLAYFFTAKYICAAQNAPISCPTTCNQSVDRENMPAIDPPTVTAGLNAPPEIDHTAYAQTRTVNQIANP